MGKKRRYKIAYLQLKTQVKSTNELAYEQVNVCKARSWRKKSYWLYVETGTQKGKKTEVECS